ncbi:response regulator transcription factor [Lacticaseibacillus sharpeae]|uniref:Response regulator n=1 Tax=Lacticaseibacillus sharpeae JCM 1186 = DSM 20505 TaxID=1291052 RepID=A0A0R1ZLT7_9LACO|nr:response regulator transcription factor [Lacticaseibacillus sharpeae]KRM55370.1 response regulator [Lacticaseibacillus sharpeae JCM 1186 = DSM 20505]
MTQTIFLVEDEPTIAATISHYLAQWGYTVKAVQDFNHVDAEVAAAAPNLVLMDIRLPFFNGFHWLECIRRTSKVPVMFLTSVSDDMNLVMAMNMGADDFLTKPIELPVLLAKIQGLLRRTYEYQQQDGRYPAGQFELAALDNRVTSIPLAQSIDLTPTETRILRMLFASPGAVVSREDIIAKLWASDAFIDQNTLAVTMTRLRQKVAPIALDQVIQTVRGAGYRLAVQPNA